MAMKGGSFFEKQKYTIKFGTRVAYLNVFRKMLSTNSAESKVLQLNK